MIRKAQLEIDLIGTTTYIPQFTVDCVALGFHVNTLKVLLCKMPGVDYWMLPCGFVRQDEDVDAAAIRILDSRTSIKDVYLKQYYLFGKKDRVIDIEKQEEALTNSSLDEEERKWMSNRFLSLGYYALVEYNKVKVKAEQDMETAWFCLHELPEMCIDHKEVIKIAMRSIRNDVGYIPIGYELLAPKFTMPEMRIIYETILGRELDRRNFQRKMLSTGLIRPLNETRKDGAHKSPNLYSFNKDRYKEAQEHGLQLMHIIL